MKGDVQTGQEEEAATCGWPVKCPRKARFRLWTEVGTTVTALWESDDCEQMEERREEGLQKRQETRAKEQHVRGCPESKA